MTPTEERLIEQITEAFDGVQIEDGVTLHQSEFRDVGTCGGSTSEEEARKLDTETRWQDVLDNVIEKFGGVGGLSHLDPKGYRYYLPAYMIWSIRNAPKSDNIASDFTIYSLKPYGDDITFDRFHRERYVLFNPFQREAIIAFLRYTSDEEQCWFDNSQAELGLGFWKKYNEDRLAEGF